MSRPTPDEIAEARAIVDEIEFVGLTDDQVSGIQTLHAATEPPTDEDLFAVAESAFENAVAEDQDDYIEGFFHGVRHFLGSPVKS